jgi:rubredoxin
VQTIQDVSYACAACGWVYRPAEHNGVEFADLLPDWTCPQCQADQNQFAVLVPAELPTDGSEETEGLESREQPDETLGTPLEQRVVYTNKAELSVYELHRQKQLGELKLQPEFQRYYVWSAKQESRLIESIFLNVPIPLVYIAEEPSGTYAVIDGQQRLTALFRFMDGEYAISSLEHRTDLNGKRFADLGRELQRQFENCTLSVVQIRKESDPDVRFEVFERLNTGATKLNDQEIRNCVYRGPFNDFLRRQAKYTPFQRLLGLQQPDPRMADVELVLRFAAFWDQTYLHYNSKLLKAFLNRQMERGAGYTAQRYQDLERIFWNAVQLSQTVFGEQAFRRFVPGSQADRQGQWENHPNKALYDVVMWGFTRYAPAQIMPLADAIFEELINLMCTDQEFSSAITYATADRNKVQLRFSRWQAAALRDRPHLRAVRPANPCPR